jgi:hypothetical protein
MKELTKEQQEVINRCYEMLASVDLKELEIGLPIPRK